MFVYLKFKCLFFLTALTLVKSVTSSVPVWWELQSERDRGGAGSLRGDYKDRPRGLTWTKKKGSQGALTSVGMVMEAKDWLPLCGPSMSQWGYSGKKSMGGMLRMGIQMWCIINKYNMTVPKCQREP